MKIKQKGDWSRAATPWSRKIILAPLALVQKILNRSIYHSGAIVLHDAQVCTIPDTRRLLHNGITKEAGNSISFYQEVAVLEEKEFLRTEITDKRIDTPISVWRWLAFNFHLSPSLPLYLSLPLYVSHFNKVDTSKQSNSSRRRRCYYGFSVYFGYFNNDRRHT